MASLQQVNEALGKLVTFLTPLVPLIGCHMVDFVTLGHWDNLLPPQLQQDLLSLPSSVLHQLPSATLPFTHDDTDEGNAEPWSLCSSDLASFLSQVRQHYPAALGMTTPIEQILEQYGSEEMSVLPMKGVMSLKKTHEVEVMGQVIARLAKGLNVSWLVDLGSGRGYLTTSLVVQYSQQVVAIDSSSSNISSALARNTKLKRLWDNLTHAWQDRAQGRHGRKGKTRRKVIAHQEKEEQEDTKQQVNQNTGRNKDSHPDHLNGCFFGVTKFITDNTDLLELVRNAVGSEKVKTENASLSNGGNSGSEKGISGSEKQAVDSEDPSSASPHPGCISKEETHTTTTTQGTNTKTQDPPLTDSTCLVNERSVLGLVGLHTCGNLASSSLRLFVANPRVHLLCNVGCCYHLLEEEFSRNTYNQRKTPDDSAVQSSSPVHKENLVLKHAGDEHSVIKQDCNAPQCCTNHDQQELNTHTIGSPHSNKECVIPPTCEKEDCLPPQQISSAAERQGKGSAAPPQQISAAESQEEGCAVPDPQTEPKDEGDIDPLHPSSIPNLGHGFPLSSFLRERRFTLGRNTRMLSSQAADRLTQGNLGGPESLYWRALLQVVLVDKLGDVSELSHVGRLSSKCQSFTEYARLAMARLGVSIDITEEELEEYDVKHSSIKDQLERFFLVRASVAAVVEGAMLLDRLAFLCEQEDVSAYLVPLFDPVTSPRCHALVAVRGAGAKLTL